VSEHPLRDQTESPLDAGLAVAEREPAPDDVLWHRGWLIGLIAAAALMLLTAGGVSAQVLLMLAIMAVPAIIGALWRPKTEERFALLALWALAATLAVCVTGGLSGPAAVFLVTPAIVALVVDGAWTAGIGLSVAAVLVCGLAGVLHLPPSPPPEPARTGLTIAAVLLTACAAGAAALLARRRSDNDKQAAEEEILWFQGLMADLPELGMTMDGQGRTEAVFGQPLDGFGAEAVNGGLTVAASLADRAKVEAALATALSVGAATVVFTPAIETTFRVSAALHRTGVGGVAAILRKVPETTRVTSAPAVQAASEPTPQPPTPQPPADFAERLAAAEAGRTEAEIGRERAEATAASRALFLANMSHELRTPLNAIMGFSDMMRARMFGEMAPKYAEYAELIHESGGHLLDLINDVLDMSKIEAQRYTLSREVFDIRDALNAALRLMRLQADEAGVKLRAVLPGAPLMVDADKRAIKQMALNLLSNAVKFTPKGGSVILTAHTAAGVLEMIVADTGVGIAADDLKRLGQPYEQAGGSDDRARGTGLGLSLVDAFAKLHGGTMTLESRLGEGTAVTVRIPVLEPVVDASVEAPLAPVVEPTIAAEAEAEAEASKAENTSVPPPLTTLAANDAAPVKMPEPAVPSPPVELAAEAPVVEAIAPTVAEPDPAPSAPTNQAEAAPEAPSTPIPEGLGPLHARSMDHEGLRQSGINIFSRSPPIGPISEL